MTDILDGGSLLNDQELATLFRVLRFVGTPKTIDEIAGEFDWHPQTARRHLWTLRGMNKVRTLSRRQGRKQLWQAVTGSATGGQVVVATTAGTFRLGNLTNWQENVTPAANIIAACLAYVWRRQYYKRLDQGEAINVARQGTLDMQLEIFPFMCHVLEQVKATYQVLEQMLVDMPELWNEAPVALSMIGLDLDRASVEETAKEFEPMVQAWLATRQRRG